MVRSEIVFDSDNVHYTALPKALSTLCVRKYTDFIKIRVRNKLLNHVYGVLYKSLK